ncbi:MAG TPA: hypothetical protein VHA13_04075 [Gammaproteobacteria bacterium]|nr:hypothetical protein [Gammaproteobacteria bacterium]
MPNKYSYNGTDTFNNQACVTADIMSKFDLSSAAITEFSLALYQRNLAIIHSMFQVLTTKQKVGLFSFTFDFNEFSGSFMSTSQPIGMPHEIAKQQGNIDIINFLAAEQAKVDSYFHKACIGLFPKLPTVLGEKIGFFS